MDKNCEIIENFETLLKQQGTKTPLTIYKDRINQNLAARTANKKLNPQCIISNLAKQIKAIQKSENVKSVKKPAVNMEKYKKSSFLPINMLQEEGKPPHPPDPQKFDTQLVSNTQLISIVEDAEALDVNVGMTQEFETTFYDGDDDTGDNQKPTQQNASFPILDISLKEPDPNPILSPQKLEQNKNDGIVLKLNDSPELQFNTDTQFDNYTQILDEIKDIDDIGKIIDNRAEQEDLLSSINDLYDIEEPLSPVFNVHSKKNDETAPPLVFALETFENFEKIAMPVIEHTQNKEEAKFLINSQIIGKELILRTYFEDIERISPVIEICDKPLKIDKELISNNNMSCNTNDDKIDEKKRVKDIQERSPNKCFLKDEILFSSDEEDEYLNQSYKDLPFTCALETSFYDNSEVLDKTMYVGFQTASNKSIQIGTESFCNAKSLLDCVEQDLKNEGTLTALIEMCESNKVKADMTNANEFASIPTETSCEVSETCGHKKENTETIDADKIANVTESITTSISMEVDVQEQKCKNNIVTSIEIPTDNVTNILAEKVNDTISVLSTHRKFEGFETKSKSVFQNLDLDGSFEFSVENLKKAETDKIIPMEKFGKALTEEQNMNDTIIREFEEEIMHTELEDIIRNIDNDDDNVEKYKPRSFGFRTASNKNIRISGAALAESKNIFNDIDLMDKMETNYIVTEKPNIIDNDKNIPPKIVSFKTARNKEIKISDKGLIKTRNIFNDFDLNDNITVSTVEDSNRLQIHKSQINIDQPLTSKLIQIKDSKETQSSNKETKLLSVHKNDLETLHMKASKNNQTEFCGFKTAGNKNITISAKARSKSKQLFSDIEINESVFNNDPEDAEPPFYGFEENDEYMGLIAETLEKSQNIFKKLTISDNNGNKFNISDVNLSKTAEDETHNNENLSSNSKQSLNIGFKTASNKDVKISERALSMSRKIFQDMNDCDNEKPDTNTQFIGFKTASNREVNISDRALERSRTLFQDISEDECAEINSDYIYKNTENTHSAFNGFQTASKKRVKISAEALAKSKNIFQDINNDTSDEINDTEPNLNSINMNTKFEGFQTANNQKIKVSEIALAKSRKIFQDINYEKPTEIKAHESAKHSSTFVGFQTASKKEVKVSEEALAKSRKIFQDINDEETTEIKAQERAKHSLTFVGFQTASKKEVKVSEEALAKSRKIFQDINDEKTTEIKAQERAKPSSTFVGFQTASKMEVKVSEEALAKSRKIFQDINDEETTEIKAQERAKPSSKFVGFQTASKMEVKVSEEALAKSRKIFQDINDGETTEMKAQERDVSTKPISTFIGFQTASKKQVKISEEALAKSRKIFQDINDGETTEMKAQERDVSTKPISTFIGFQTASKKQVKISEEALAKSRKMFQDINDEKSTDMKSQENRLYPKPSSTIIGFQSASKNKVNISVEALAKSRMIFQDIHEEKTTEINAQTSRKIVNKGESFKGFQTAHKKEVKISEEALAKSKKIFQDIDEVERKGNTNELNQINESSGIMFKGFHTASNKNVAISEEAIAKSRKLFQDLDLSAENNKNTFNSETPKTDSQLKSKSKDSVLNTADNTKISKNLSAGNLNKQSKPKIELEVEQKCSEIFEDIDTQILNNFEVSMHEITPKISKRSGSPILSCPKSKKRKVFQIPYSQKSPKKSTDLDFKPPTVHSSENTYNFSLTYKKIRNYSLNELQRIEEVSTATENIDPYIQQFDFESIHNFKFTGSRNDITKLVLNLSDLKDLFLNSVNKKLVPDGWLDIQLQLIIWKLISYEIKFPKIMRLTCTAKNVMEQLKYRYDKELYNAERPALRKIFEKDDTSTKTLILCVVAVSPAQDTSQPPELLLTDGWYIIKAVIDKMLAKYVNSGKIRVGIKLVTHGAELVGSEQAVSPWEDTSLFRLKIFGNSTRRARWDARLGYHGNGAILSQLSTVALEGGKISKLRVFVTRVYPPLYVDKFEDGSTVTRSERLEHLHQMKFEMERQALLEKIYEDVEKEVLDQDLEDSEGLIESEGNRKHLDSGSQIAKKMKMSRDPAEFRTHLTSTQTALLEEHTSRERERLIQTIQTKVQDKMAALGVTLTRNVVALYKVRVAGVSERNGGVEVTKALLSIWRPNEAVIEMIKEGTWMEILNVVPTAVRYSELQISAGRQTVFSQSKDRESDKIKPHIASLKRTCYPIKDLVIYPAKTTDYNEVDTAGVIFEIDPANNDFDPNKHQFQNVYLTDSDKNMISVNFWGGLKKFGYDNVLDTGQIVACNNLQKRAGNSRKNIAQYRFTEFSYFTKTPKSDIARELIENLSHKLSKIDKSKFFQECVSRKTNYSIKSTSANVTPYRFPNLDINSSKNRMFIDSPQAQNSKKDENLNLTGLDFDSTFRQETQDLSPKTLLRKRQVKEKIAKLKRYGEPPPLSPLQIINKSKNAANAFKSPLISKSDVSPSVAICVKSLPNQEENSTTSDVEIQCSPVIKLNRTYVKRSNPVKLNFSKHENSLNEAVDEFAEDFDCSPPLSLD